jgi:hypothetical protein
MLNYMAGRGHADPGPRCDNLPVETKKAAFAELCRALGIEPGPTWVLEISHEGILQFTRPLTETERAQYLKPGRRGRRPQDRTKR